MVGSGCVNAESFFTVATEKNFFIKLLQFKSIIEVPEVSNEGLVYSEQNAGYANFMKFYGDIPVIGVYY